MSDISVRRGATRRLLILGAVDDNGDPLLWDDTTVRFTARPVPNDPDGPVIEKLSDGGGITLYPPADPDVADPMEIRGEILLLPADTIDLPVSSMWWDLQAARSADEVYPLDSGRLTLGWRATLVAP